MEIVITLNTDNPEDAKFWANLLKGGEANAAAQAPETPAPAPKAAAKPKAAAPKPEPAPAPAEDLVEGSAELREQVVNVATELVSKGQSAKVREALAALEAKRVSDLGDDQLEAFLTAVNAG